MAREAPDSTPRRLSAEVTTTPAQRLLFLALAALVLGTFCLERWYAEARVFNAILLGLYLLLWLQRVAAVAAALMPGLRPGARRPAIPEDDLRRSADRLPVISILVPMYHEVPVVEQIVGALQRLQYPADRLEALLLLEEDDVETREVCESLPLPSWIRTMVVPPGEPRTKPRACNYGLVHCRGDLAVIFDAEDQPEGDQLLMAALHLLGAPPRVACVQARLAFYNPDQNLLTRWFAAEYLSWFELVLPGLSRLGSPVPLGGTSNYFRVPILREVGGWDPWNVAEDCDLAMRLYRSGYRVEMLDSTTWEESCSRLGAWTRQRSRWVKGYLQTWLVHSRRPREAVAVMGLSRYVQFHMLVGGTVFCLLANPFYWLLSLAWIAHPSAVETAVFTPESLAMGHVCLYAGNLFFITLHVAGAIRRRQWSLVAAGALVPFYWVMMSAAAWKGAGQLLWRPHYWEKTTHGLARMPPAEALPAGGEVG